MKQTDEKVPTSDGRLYTLEGTHTPRCKREKHEDWQHGTHGCAVGPSEQNHCDCKVRWREAVAVPQKTRFGQ